MAQGERYRVLLAASEVVGFAKTGGLADVVGSLPQALARRGHHCVVILPLYRCTLNAKIPPEPTDLTFNVPVGTRIMPGRLWRSKLPDADVPVYLIEQPEYYDPDDAELGHGLYQCTLSGGQKSDYPANCGRFMFFSPA